MKIADYIAYYADGQVEVSPGVTYNLTDIINKSHRLLHAKFETATREGDFDPIFYRIAWVVHRTIVMASDIDLKDLNMYAMNPNAIPLIGLTKMGVRSHLLRTYFGKFVDKVLSEMSWFGTSITKRVNGQVETVDLRNIVRAPHIKDIQESGLAERQFLTLDEVRAKSWGNMDEVKEMFELLEKDGEHLLPIIEWWTFDDELYEEGHPKYKKLKKYHKVCKVYLDRSNNVPTSSKEAAEWDPFIELDCFITPEKKRRTSSKLREKLGEYEEMFPYEQADFFDAPGRWLSFGCGELLSGLQEHYNEKNNLYRKKDILDLRGIFVHKYTNNSNSLTQDYLDNLDTGTVLSMSTEEDFQRLVVDMKTSEFIATTDKLYELARLIMGISAQGTGEDLPSSVSATASVINNQSQQTTYDFVRERMHHYLVKLFMDGYFDDIIGEMTEEDMVVVLGDPREFEEIDKYFINNLVNYKVLQWKEDTGMYPTEEEVTALKEKLAMDIKGHGNMRFAELKKELIGKAGYIIEFAVNNEGFDVGRKVQNLLQLKNDPSFTGSREAIDAEIMQLMNMNPNMYRKTDAEKQAEAEAIRQQQMADAGMVAPANNASAITGGEMSSYTGEEQTMRANRV